MRQRGYLFWTITAIVALAIATLAFTRPGQSLLAPSPVKAGHDVPQVACTQCHSAFQGIDQVVCEDCHKGVMDAIADEAGVHGLLLPDGDKPCMECHAVHENRGSDRTPVGYFHDERKDQECLECHTDPPHHSSSECKDCHSSMTDWFKTTYDHPRVREHSYRRWTCATCHPNNYEEFTCLRCHVNEDPQDDDEHMRKGWNDEKDYRRTKTTIDRKLF